MALSYPVRVDHIKERTLVARIKVQYPTGEAWLLVDIVDTFTQRPSGDRYANVQSLPLPNGHVPEVWPHWTHGGWTYASSCQVPASALHDVAVVEDGQVVEFLGEPPATEFVPTEPVPVELVLHRNPPAGVPPSPQLADLGAECEKEFG